MIDEELLSRASRSVRYRFSSDLNFETWIQLVAKRLKIPEKYLREYIADKEEGYA